MSLTPKTSFKAVDQGYFDGGRNGPGSRADGSLANILAYQRSRLRGVIPSARLPFSVNPANNDVVGIGGHTFKFVTVLGAAAAYTQVQILGSAALTKAAFLDAINSSTANSNAAVVPATTPFSKPVLADSGVANVVRVRLADSQGGTPIPNTSASIALTASITGGAAAWDVADLSATGMSLTVQDQAYVECAVTAEMVTAGSKAVELDFTPTKIAAFSEQGAWSISGNAVVIAMTDGANPYYQVGEVARALVFGSPQ